MPAGDAVAVKGNVTLTATTEGQPSLTSTATSGNLDAFFVINKDSTLTIGQSVADASFSYKNSNRWLAYVNEGGKLIVNNGTFDHIDTTTNPDKNRHQGTLAYNKSGDITINGGTFTNNKAAEGGVVYNNAGSITVKGGKFSNNTAVNGGVLFQTGDQASLSISDGVFSSNKSVDSGDNAGGGVLFQEEGKTTITGGTFTGNAQTYTAECTNDNPSACRHMRSGGGAIHTQSGSLTITGNVTFSKNYSKAYGWGDGGGAIYARGTLWIRNDVQGNKPKFDGNWAGIYDTQFVKDADNKEQVPNGGAGGAIFLQDYSTAYLMGGSFTNNSSGYLGGAIYTEENSTTYIAKAVAYANIAGHFGGGLWLCPSGSGEASKGGNISLFDNEVDKSIDPNEDNQNPKDVNGPNNTEADGTEAGADFAIMNPYHKAHGDTSFMLMDTWFTDRTESAVTWYHDGIPVQNASGYDDSYQNPNKTNWDKPFPYPGTNVAVTKSDGRYTDGQKNTKIEDNEYEDHVKNLTLGWGSSSNAEFKKSGVALKAIVKGTPQEQESRKASAKSSAAVVISGNKARLSGGAFGTNGNVLFSTPYTSSWNKVDSTDSSKKLGGSQWDLTGEKKTADSGSKFTGTADTDKEQSMADTEERAMIEAVKQSSASGPFNVDYYPTLCAATKDADDNITAFDTGYTDGKCWKPEFEGYLVTENEEDPNDQNKVTSVTVSFTSVTLSAIVVDNIGKGAYAGFDNNPDAGGFDLNNLAPGTYTVKERVSPTGYELNTNTYQFKITNSQAKWQKLNTDGTSSGDFTETEIDIPDKALPGVSWSKIDADTNRSLEYSSWIVTKYQSDGETLETKSRWIVNDCVKLTDKDVDCATTQNSGEYLADHSKEAGKFNISGLQPGKYLLQEDAVPDGYWNPEDSDRYEFTIPQNANKTVTLTKIGSNAPVTDIANELPQISWKKVAKDSGLVIDSGASEWTITGPEAVIVQGDIETDASAEADSVTANVVDCQSLNGSTDPCSSHATGVQSQTGTDGTVSRWYNDLDNDLGQLTVSGLQRPTAEQSARGIVFRYVLQEKTAPNGYVRSMKQYTFTVSAKESSSSLDLGETCTAAVGGTNCIPNVKIVSALPLTGGPGDWAARDWLLIGGGLAVAAAGAMALTYEWRRRKAVSL